MNIHELEILRWLTAPLRSNFCNQSIEQIRKILAQKNITIARLQGLAQRAHVLSFSVIRACLYDSPIPPNFPHNLPELFYRRIAYPYALQKHWDAATLENHLQRSRQHIRRVQTQGPFLHFLSLNPNDVLEVLHSKGTSVSINELKKFFNEELEKRLNKDQFLCSLLCHYQLILGGIFSLFSDGLDRCGLGSLCYSVTNEASEIVARIIWEYRHLLHIDQAESPTIASLSVVDVEKFQHKYGDHSEMEIATLILPDSESSMAIPIMSIDSSNLLNSSVETAEIALELDASASTSTEVQMISPVILSSSVELVAEESCTMLNVEEPTIQSPHPIASQKLETPAVSPQRPSVFPAVAPPGLSPSKHTALSLADSQAPTEAMPSVSAVAQSNTLSNLAVAKPTPRARATSLSDLIQRSKEKSAQMKANSSPISSAPSTKIASPYAPDNTLPSPTSNYAPASNYAEMPYTAVKNIASLPPTIKEVAPNEWGLPLPLQDHFRGWVNKIEQHIGGYQILEIIASGGMGTIYKVKNPQNGQIMAIKQMQHPEEASDEDLLRFQQEARLATTLNHPNIVKVYDSGVHDKTPYLVMDYIPGIPLSKLIAKDKLPPRQALTVMRGILEGLAYAHRKGIIHRDIKPSNIMLMPSFLPLIMDFGLAKNIFAKEQQITKIGQVLGTPQYMAPEQARGRIHELNTRTDIYSAGVVLYEMLTGVTPIQGHTPVDILYNVVAVEPIPIRQLNPHIPPALAAICQKAMEKENDQRYACAEDMIADILRFSDGRPVLALRSYGARYRFRKWYHQNHKKLFPILIAICSMLLCLLAMLVFLFTR